MGSHTEEEGSATEGQPLELVTQSHEALLAEPHDIFVKLQPYESDLELETGHDMGLETGDEGAAGAAGHLPERVSFVDIKMPMPRHHHAKRKKVDKKLPAVTAMAWMCVDANGSSALLQCDKWQLAEKLGIQARDLRLLDPQPSSVASPCAILCRERSIIVNLEHIKAIITVDKVLVVNYGQDEYGTKFADELSQRLINPGTAHKLSSSIENMYLMGQSQLTAEPGAGLMAPATNQASTLPFELRALECCLESLAATYDVLATDLEVAAYPLLDGLAQGVTTDNLDAIRRKKNKLVRLTTRVETVREVLEKFLNDHDDMHDFNLTANLDRELALQEERDRALQEAATVAGELVDDLRAPSSISLGSTIVDNEVADVEMLLEAYYMHIDATFNRLQTLNEYIKDTEDMVTIKMNQLRNAMLTVSMVFMALMAAIAVVSAISSFFCMNLSTEIFQGEAPDRFYAVTISTTVGGIMLFAAFVAWAWWRKMLVFA
jgi:magnesium transporter